MPRPECPACGKTFARQSHLDRHQAMHGDSMRWPCSHCGSTYTRRDALNRHLSRCANGGVANAHVPSSRINRSCEECSTRKIKCSRGQPCRRCSQASLRCRYLVHGLSRHSRMAALPAAGQIEVAGTVINRASNETHGLDIANSVDPQPASLGTDSSQDFHSAGDTNPWLSWGWTDPVWDNFDLVPPIDLDASHEHPMSGSPAGNHAFDTRETLTSDITSSRIARIVDARIDPVEHHRQFILQRVEQSSGVTKRGSAWQWLNRAHFPLLLKTYFIRHHRHTPIIHLPTLNIAECPTSLIFAIVLIAASSLPKLELRPKDLVALAHCAYEFAMELDESTGAGRATSIGKLQALVLLAILDRIMLKRSTHATYIVDLGNMVQLARAEKIFEEHDDPSRVSWQHWAVVESRRRLGLIVYAFDAFISVLHDETPNVRNDELNLRFPSPENMFMAASENEWNEASQLRTRSAASTFSVSLTFSSLFCNTAVPLPDTLMGRFVLLNGILQHAWRTKCVLQENISAMSNSAFSSYSRSKEHTIHQALRQWRDGWPDRLLDFEPIPERPSLYQDRAEAYWHLAGVIMLPYVVMSTPKRSAIGSSGSLSVQEMLERLMLLSDQNLLPSVGQDFDATYRMITGHQSNTASRRALGALIYRETETMNEGFVE